MVPELLLALTLSPEALPAAAKAPAAVSSTTEASATLMEEEKLDFTNTVTAERYLRKFHKGIPGKVIGGVNEGLQRGVLAAYDARLKGAKWADKTFNKPRPPAPTERPILGFEKEGESTWDTNGYVELARSEEHATQGKWSCRAEFMLPADLGTPTGTAWRASMVLPFPARGPGAQLPVTDWSPFKSVRFDISNPATGALAFAVGIVDIRGYKTEAMRTVPAWGATTVEITMQEIRTDRLDLARISGLSIGVDPAGRTVRPVAYIDNLRFELFPPKLTSTVSIDMSETATGAAGKAGSKPAAKPTDKKGK